MNNILYISGDGLNSTKQKWKIYFNYFDPFWKNHYITKELKSLVDNCEIIKFSWWFGHPIFLVKLESFGLLGTTRIKVIYLKV